MRRLAWILMWEPVVLVFGQRWLPFPLWRIYPRLVRASIFIELFCFAIFFFSCFRAERKKPVIIGLLISLVLLAGIIFHSMLISRHA